MSATKLFITGATGWIGGAVLGGILKHYPQLEVTALLRSPSQEFTENYPGVKVVKGSFGDFEVIERATQDAEIIIHTGDTDHIGCAKAILSGLAKKKTPSYLIHLTGTGCISDHADPGQTWEGKYNPHQWHDMAEIEELYNLPDSAMHHPVDRWIQDADTDLIKTATICPPDIYGQSTSIGKTSTFLVPKYVEALLKHQQAFYLGEGNNIRAVTHIDDIVSLFVIMVEQALQGGGTAEWGKEGFYFAVSDSVRWKDAAQAISSIGQQQGWLPKDSKPVSWTKEQVGALLPEAPGRVLYLWGSNSRAESARARKLGWKPSGPSFWECLEEDCRIAGLRGRRPFDAILP